jgi:NNP family nitrate/nitrite transporter-like MFS transporter
MCLLYVGTFGSFIGFSAGLALLTKAEFPSVNPTAYAFLGPLAGALTRPVGGWISDRIGGARVTLWTFIAMMAAVIGVMVSLPHDGAPGSFAGFLAMFIVLFALTGIGNGSTFRMIPVIFLPQKQREAAGRSEVAKKQAVHDAGKESAAVLGFAGAIGAYGGFFIPRSFGTSIGATGSPVMALCCFIAFYAVCAVVTWWCYARRNAPMPC